MIVSLLTYFSKRLALFIVFLFLALSVNGQWLAGYEYRKSITIPDANIIGGPHTDFPLLIDLSSDADIPVDAYSALGYDIVFTDDDGLTLLDHEIVVYDRTNYKAFVRLDLPNLSDKSIYVYYGNPTISSDPSTSDAYSTNFQAVWHMEEEPFPSNNISDATSNGNTGTPGAAFAGASSVGGKIGQAISFNGTSDYFSIANSTSVNLSGDQFTIQAWINAPDNTTDNAIMVKGLSDGNEQYMLGIGNAATPDYVDSRVRLGGSTITDQAGSITAGSWQHIVFVYDGTLAPGARKTVYLNGALLYNGPFAPGGNVVTSVSPLYIGKRLVANNYISGLLDELRIADVPRSLNWVQTEYNNQNLPVGFVNYGSETGPGPLPDVSGNTCFRNNLRSGTTNITFSTPNGNPVTSYQWTAVFDSGISGNASGSGNTLNEILENTNTTAGTATYTVTAYSGVYPGYSTNVLITVNPNPEKTVSAAETAICNNSSTFIIVDNSEVGTDYQLRDSGDTDIGSPQNGTGSSLSFSTGILTSTTTFKIVATNTRQFLC